MMSVTELARTCGLSRSTILYYESVGLLRPASRGSNSYRRYGERELDRLREICRYRAAGLTLADIRALRDGRTADAEAVLQRRLGEIGEEIERLRTHQRSIVALLKNSSKFRRLRDMTKDKWVAIMRSSGLKDEDMRRWHAEFEKAAPEDHEEFLRFLHIAPEEIIRIREWSRGSAVHPPRS